jgi:hypothetical protein
MNRRQKTASHLERMVLTDMRRYALCNGVSAVTVRPTADGMGWEVADFYAPGGVPAARSGLPPRRPCASITTFCPIASWRRTTTCACPRMT